MPSGGSGSALFLSPEAPWPPIGGGALRSGSLLEYLTRHYQVDAVLFSHSHAVHPAASLPPGKIRRVLEIPLLHHSRHPLARVARNAQRLALKRPPLLDRFSGHENKVAQFVAGQHYDLAVIEHFWCAPYIETIPATTTVLDLHNIESVWHRTLAAGSGILAATAHQRFAQAYQNLETQWLPRYDRLLVTSQADASRLQHPNIVVYPNSLPLVPPLNRHEENLIAFSGNLEFEPNRAAVAHFARQIWPQLRHRFPHLRWRIIGKNPHGVRAFTANDPSIELTGPVDDAIAALARARVAVVPVLAGSGTRMKILEAWAAATPIVSTTIGAEGLNACPGQHLLIADDPSSFIESVTTLLGSAELRNQMGQAGYRLCQERYTWTKAWTVLDSAFHPDSG